MMRTLLHRGVRLIILMAFSAPGAAVSGQLWTVSAQAGEMRSSLDPAAATTSISLGLGFEAHSGGFRLSTGLPTSSVESLWAGAGAWKRLALRRRGLIAGIDLAGNAFVTRDRSARATGGSPIIPGPFVRPLDDVADRSGHALAGQALPIIGYEGGHLQIHARAGASVYQAAFGGLETDRTVRLADVQLTLMPTTSLAVMPAVRHYDADDEIAATYAGGTAIFAHRLGTIWGSAGHWLESDPTGVPWAAGASLKLHERVTVEASARRDTFDPLYLQPPQTSWNLGASLQVGGSVAAPAPPIPAEYADGRATIQVPVSVSASAPSIAGDFNGWQPALMQRTGEHWTYTVTLDPGVYHYSFVNADGEWFVPEDTPGRRDDGMGGHVAVLVVG